MSKNFEIYVTGNEVRVRFDDGTDIKLEGNEELVRELYRQINAYFPWAMQECEKQSSHRGTSKDTEARAVDRFCRCNFANRDSVPDFKNGKIDLEEVPCSLRGICPHEGVICKPKPKLDYVEFIHAVLLLNNYSKAEIAKVRDVAKHTVQNSVSRLIRRLGCKDEPDMLRTLKGWHLERTERYSKIMDAAEYNEKVKI